MVYFVPIALGLLVAIPMTSEADDPSPSIFIERQLPRKAFTYLQLMPAKY